MSDVIESQNEGQVEEINFKELYEKTKADLESVVAKKEELLTEAKKAKEARRNAEEMANKVALETAQKNGEFEKLWKTSEAEKNELQKQLQEFLTSNRKEKLQVTAMRIATELADGDNAELLSDFISRSLDKVADEKGHLGDDVLKSVAETFKTDAKYKSLLRMSKANGGGAPGNVSSASQSKIITRDQFAKMNPMQQMQHVKSGGQVVDSL